MSLRTVGVLAYCRSGTSKTLSTLAASSFRRISTVTPTSSGWERPGRTHESANSARHAVGPRQDLHRAEKQNFVDEVAKALNEANTRDEFDRLVLVAPAHALGELNHALDAPTRRKIGAQLQKDLTNVPNADLAKHFDNLGDA